ncbi:MAG: hypothetical protein Fur0037_03390 [Planctomycetota bacterium]
MVGFLGMEWPGAEGGAPPGPSGKSRIPPNARGILGFFPAGTAPSRRDSPHVPPDMVLAAE